MNLRRILMFALLLPTALGAASASIADPRDDEIAALKAQVAKQQATISKQQTTIKNLEAKPKQRSVKSNVATVAPPPLADSAANPKPGAYQQSELLYFSIHLP
jgi:hypothetical protein